MTLGNFEHIRASSLEEASSLAETPAASSEGETLVVAGGTDLLGLLKDRVHPSYPKRLVDLKGILGLDFIGADERGARIGALASLADIAKSPILRSTYPLVAEAARAVASPQIRNMGTLGGNICQEPRCWYYRNPDDRFRCLRKGGAKCNAIVGENRYHSIFGAAQMGMPACRSDCPGNVDIPRYLERIRAGDPDGAARILLLSNPMPAITGRVCPHYCEKACNRGEMDGPVSVRAIERSLGDYILENADRLMPPPERLSGKSVAVVGSGPAGLAAAYYLRRSGHEVRVFERMPAAGGMLAYGIPAYRLPKDVVAKLIRAYERMGIAFEPEADLGGEAGSLDELRVRFDRVFLATGAWTQKTIPIAGAELPGSSILGMGLDFLIDIQKGRREAPGRKVLVIGGGNVAVDVAISALRLGAEEVTMACLEARDIMPAFPEDLEDALNEGVRLLPSWGPRALLRRGGAAIGLDLVRCTSVFDAKGRFGPSFDPAQTAAFEADRILLAIGQGAELSYAEKALNIERGLIVADGKTQATSLAGVFAGGDATTGPASVVAALAAGRRAAAAIDSGLSDAGERRRSSPAPAVSEPGRLDGELRPVRQDSLRGSKRVFIPALAASRRGISIEDVATIERTQIESEAQRCLDCGCVAVNASDIAPALVALGAAIRTNRRSIAAEDFFVARPFGTTVLEAGELVTEIDLPAPEPGSSFSFHKFRARNAIDFPVLSVAAAFLLDGGRVKRASIVFGAVAPVPLRARLVEEFIVGRELDEETAEAAGSLAARGTYPLERNGYKVQVLKALVRKAIITLR
jgi:NADPH-dependent glutamate synthase beta subunit-like oxidoreductase/CO/xanthine dehydrogenase FAD-binding subunit